LPSPDLMAQQSSFPSQSTGAPSNHRAAACEDCANGPTTLRSRSKSSRMPFSTVADALSYPLIRRAAALSPKKLRREVPIMLRLDDGTLAEGIVDLAFLEEGSAFTGWTVVDFKTDLEFESGRIEYSAQVALYVEAIEKATNSTARGILFVV
jgi:ATP-dependent exoDNAse (exonuclease V) beta subunit